MVGNVTGGEWIGILGIDRGRRSRSWGCQLPRETWWILTSIRSSTLISPGLSPMRHRSSDPSSMGSILRSLRCHVSWRKVGYKASTYQHETLYAFCHILGEFGNGYGARRATEILCWDLSAPLSITWPLKKRCETMKKKWSNVLTNLESDGNAGSTTLEHDLLTVDEVPDPWMQGIVEWNSTLAGGMFHMKVDRSFEQDVLHIALAVAGSVRLVHGLGNEGSSTIWM